MSTRIGGVTVARGSVIRWGALASVLAGSWFFAAVLNVVDYVQAVAGLLGDVTGGVREFVVEAIGLLYDGGADAIDASWASFGEAVQVLGPFAYPATVLVVILAFVAIQKAAVAWGSI